MAAEPITVAITRRVDSARHDELIAWLHAGSALAERFPGYLGAGWVTSPDSDEWHMLYRFQDADTLRGWDDSPQRRWWLDSAGDLVEATRTEQRTGIEGWFDAPDGVVLQDDGSIAEQQPAVPPSAPPRWKQMATIYVVFLPLSIVANLILGRWLADSPVVLRVLVVTTVMTPLMTYVLLPWMTRRLQWWLQGAPPPWRRGRRTTHG